jgi:glycosyltransferase involved in cell wall biosynthesis
LQGDDIFLDALQPTDREQAVAAMKRLVSYVDRFLVHSHDYGQRMAQLLDIPNHLWSVVPLGIDTTEFQSLALAQHGTGKATQPARIGYLARMAPEKGLHQLVDAFIELAKRRKDSDFQLCLAGWLGPQHEAFWNKQQSKLQNAGLEDRFSYAGILDRQAKLQFLSQLDLFSVPTVYQEPKGLFVLEAVAAGVPYLQPAHGAFPELHQRLQFGQLFVADDQADYVNKLELQLERILAGRNGESQAVPEVNRAELLEEISIHRMSQRLLATFSP